MPILCQGHAYLVGYCIFCRLGGQSCRAKDGNAGLDQMESTHSLDEIPYHSHEQDEVAFYTNHNPSRLKCNAVMYKVTKSLVKMKITAVLSALEEMIFCKGTNAIAWLLHHMGSPLSDSFKIECTT